VSAAQSADFRFFDSLLATDPYVAIAIARDDAKRFRAMYHAALEQTHRQLVALKAKDAAIRALREELRGCRQAPRAAA
jgi:hypothetical protein